MCNTTPIHLTNGSTMTLSHKGTLLNLPNISDKHKPYQIYSHNNSLALLLLGQLCDDNCIVVYNHEKYIIYKDKPILQAQRYPISSMYITNLNNPLLTQTKVNLLNTNL